MNTTGLSVDNFLNNLTDLEIIANNCPIEFDIN